MTVLLRLVLNLYYENADVCNSFMLYMGNWQEVCEAAVQRGHGWGSLLCIQIDDLEKLIWQEWVLTRVYS